MTHHQVNILWLFSIYFSSRFLHLSWVFSLVSDISLECYIMLQIIFSKHTTAICSVPKSSLEPENHQRTKFIFLSKHKWDFEFIRIGFGWNEVMNPVRLSLEKCTTSSTFSKHTILENWLQCDEAWATWKITAEDWYRANISQIYE